MTFQCPIPSQEKSVDYLNKVKSKVKKIRVGGHSKGGNLAVYASAFCNPAIKRRILAVYNNDGPGFSEEITNSDGYLEILPLTHSIIPQSSLVGKMLAHKEDFKIVFSTGVGGMLQHDPFTWQLLGTSFIPAKEQSVSSRLVEKTLQDWLLHVERADRQKIVDGFYSVFQKTGMETLEDLQKPSNSLAILRAMSEIDPETVKVMREGISVMGGALGKAAKEITVEKASSLKIRASLPESIKSGVNRAKKILENAEEEDEHLMISNPSESFSDNLPDKQQGEV